MLVDDSVLCCAEEDSFFLSHADGGGRKFSICFNCRHVVEIGIGAVKVPPNKPRPKQKVRYRQHVIGGEVRMSSIHTCEVAPESVTPLVTAALAVPSVEGVRLFVDPVGVYHVEVTISGSARIDSPVAFLAFEAMRSAAGPAVSLQLSGVMGTL